MRFAPRLWVVALAALGVGLSAQPAKAAFILTFGVEFSQEAGASNLSGNVVVTIADVGGMPGSVDVTVDSSGLDASLSEYISGLYLNLNPAKSPASIAATFPGNNTNPVVDSVTTGVNAFQADGDGLYDILISWQNGGGAGRFEADETDTVRLTATGLTETDFNFLSAPAGGKGPFTAVLRAQSLGANGQGSGWFSPTSEQIPSVPAPAGLVLLASAIPMLAMRRVFRRKLSAE